MAAKFILLLIISLIVLVFAIIILTGKGDNLIAGYNTSTEEDKKKYNIKRVRICIGGMLLILSPIMLMFADNFIILDLKTHFIGANASGFIFELQI